MSDRKNTVFKFFDEQKDFFRERVTSGIEAYRKGTASITLATTNGVLSSGAKVEIEQIRHHFRFGANLFMLDEFESAEKNAIYRERFPELFNIATLPFYWNTLEPTEGHPRYAADSEKIYRRPAPDLCLDYCREKGIEPKCHCLNYEGFTPDWLRWNPDYDVFKEKLERRFRDIAERYAGQIPSFEVTNEHFWGKYGNRTYSRAYDEPDFVEYSYRLAEKYFPNNHLIINDYQLWAPDTYNPRNAYWLLIENLLLKGCRVDSVGMQYHSFYPRESEGACAELRYNPERMFRLMDLYEQFGLPLQVTEMTIPAYSLAPEDEEVQAEILERVYPMFFSQKNMEAIIYWNVVDGYAAFAPLGDMTAGENTFAGGLLRFDMTEKPAWKTLDRLINKEWHTSLSLSVPGSMTSFRGFYGDYRVRVTTENGRVSEHTISLTPGSDNRFTLIV